MRRKERKKKGEAAGLIETAFDELAARWRPILDAFEQAGVDVCFEIHPGEDLHDGVTFEMFLERCGNHARCNMLFDPSHFVLQQLDIWSSSICITAGLKCFT